MKINQKLLHFVVLLASVCSLINEVDVLNNIPDYSYTNHDHQDCDHYGSFNLETLDETLTQTPSKTEFPHHRGDFDIFSDCPGEGDCDHPNECEGYAYNGVHPNKFDVPYHFTDSVNNDAEFRNAVYNAATTWNSARLYGDNVKIVNLYENFHQQGVAIKYVPTPHPKGRGGMYSFNWLAHFVGDFIYGTIEIYGGSKSDETVIMHELGHYLGLDDLDTFDAPSETLHHVLMGYAGISLQYQDIQGAAIFNNRHTEHTFDRYIKMPNGSFREICFYCGGYRTRPSNYTSLPMEDSSDCLHDYQLLASKRVKNPETDDYQTVYWLKCTKCHKTIQSDFFFKEGVDEYGNSGVIITEPIDLQATSLAIPKTLGNQTVIGIKDDAFIHCNRLEKFYADNNYFITDFRGALYDYPTYKLIAYPQAKVGPCILFDSTTAINPYAFYSNLNLTSITIPATVTTIGKQAFYNCQNLTEVIINDHSLLAVIEEAAFKYCYQLPRINIPSLVQVIGDYAFSFCDLSSLTFAPNSALLEIGAYAFSDNPHLETAYLPSGLKYLKEGAFMDTDIYYLTLPSSLKYLGKQAFDHTYLYQMSNPHLPLRSYSSWVLGYKGSLPLGLILPPSITSISAFAFFDLNLLALTIPKTITLINEGAFHLNTTLYLEHDSLGQGLSFLDHQRYQIVFNSILFKDKSYLLAIKKTSNSINHPLSSLNDPYRVGYTFGGWYNNPTFTGRALSSISLPTAPNGTYYAKWI